MTTTVPETRQLFIDLDGVLADFDGFYETEFGFRPDRGKPEPPAFWKNIERHGRFFLDMPMMSDAMELWEGAKRLHPNPIILTGLPLMSEVEDHKRRWVRQHIAFDAPVICCRSKDKRNHGKAGDILVDDWFKYRPLWEDMGGVFILHTSAAESLTMIAAWLNTTQTVGVDGGCADQQRT